MAASYEFGRRFLEQRRRGLARWLLVSAAIAALALAMTACFTDDDDGSKTTGAATAEPSAGTPSDGAAEEEEFFRVGNDRAVFNGPTAPTSFTIDDPWLVTEITTYHWNDAAGVAPGTIGLEAADGTTYGPWQAAGEPGQGGVPDAYWVAAPDVVIPPGTYTVVDSDPDTWSQNEETGGVGMSWGSGIRQ